MVKKTWVGDVEVSTVFLGCPHPGSWSDPHAAAFFETMVFGGPLDERQERYGTLGEARDGHAAVVEEVEMELRSTRVESSGDSYIH